MGTAYNNITSLGTPPVCTSRRFKPYILGLIRFRLAENPIARATTYYFSQSGNDSTGDGSQGNPWKTLVKAQAIITASSGNIALLFKCGDVWRETQTVTATIASGGATNNIQMALITTGADGFDYESRIPVTGYITLTGGTSQVVPVTSYSAVNGQLVVTGANGTTHTGISFTAPVGLTIWQKDNVTIGQYGANANGREPIITAWAAAFNVTTAVKTSGKVLTYELALTNTAIAWFGEENEIFNVYRYMGSIQQVEDTPGSWWQDPATLKLYMHPIGNQALRSTSGSFSSSGHAYQYCLPNAVSGIQVVNCTGTRIDGVQVNGYSLTLANIANQAASPACIKGDINTNQTCVISRCRIFFGFRHTIAVLSSSSGGIVTINKCQWAWGTYAGDAVAYAPYGDQETIFNECECLGSTLPQGLQPNGTAGSGSPTLAHSSFVTISSSNWSGNTVTVVPYTNAPALQLAAGRSVSLQGGTTQTKVIQSFNPADGTLVFTTSMNGTTHTYIDNCLYQNRLHLAHRCTVRKGLYQPSQIFSAPANAKQFSDLADCRCWIVECRFEGIDCREEHKNYQYYALSSAVNGATTVTLTTPQSGFLAPIANCWLLLSGGDEVPEWVLCTAYNSGTGVVTLHAGSPILGTARKWLRVPITLCNAGTVNFQNTIPHGQAGSDALGINLYDCATIGCYIEYKWLFSPNPGGGTFLNTGRGQSGLCINCTIYVDMSHMTSAIGGQTTGGLYNAAGVAGEFWFCRIHFVYPPRFSVGMDVNAIASGSSTPTALIVKACIISAELNSNGALNAYAGSGGAFGPGIGNIAGNQDNNAYVNANIKTGVGGYDNDAHAVEYQGALPLFFHPDSDSVFVTAIQTLIRGYRLEYAADGSLRNLLTPSIGPHEPLSANGGIITASDMQGGYTG